MLASSLSADRPGTSHDTPRILVCVEDEERRAALARALRDTGYEVDEATDEDIQDPDAGDYDLVLRDMARGARGSTPTLLLPDPFDVVEIEMLVLDLLGWDGPPTVRRMPVWAVTS
jgi:CheY-like chemotaxis protein